MNLCYLKDSRVSIYIYFNFVLFDAPILLFDFALALKKKNLCPCQLVDCNHEKYFYIILLQDLICSVSYVKSKHINMGQEKQHFKL